MGDSIGPDGIDTVRTTMSYLFSGTLSGVVGVTVSHPIDTIRIRMAAGSPMYRNARECMRSTVAREGYRALFKGVLSPISGVGFQNAILFGSYGPTLEVLHAIEGGDPEGPERLPNVFMAGCVGGAAQTLVATPLERLKIRMQLSTEKRLSLFQTARQMIQREGPRSLYRGFGVTMARDFPSYGTWFVSYEVLKRLFIDHYGWGGSLTPISLFFAGGSAGVLSWASSYPVDVVKTRIQSTTRSLAVRAAIREMYREYGWRGFFRGLSPTLARGFVCSGSTFLAVEAGLLISEWLDESTHVP